MSNVKSNPKSKIQNPNLILLSLRGANGVSDEAISYGIHNMVAGLRSPIGSLAMTGK